jgi:hypothetical protein
MSLVQRSLPTSSVIRWESPTAGRRRDVGGLAGCGNPESAPPHCGPPPSHDHLIGLAWHHALHARVCIERRRWWQAEYWISAVRDQVIALACVRLGHPASYAKGAHLLPSRVTAPLAAALVRSLDEAELRRALDVGGGTGAYKS